MTMMALRASILVAEFDQTFRTTFLKSGANTYMVEAEKLKKYRNRQLLGALAKPKAMTD